MRAGWWGGFSTRAVCCLCVCVCSVVLWLYGLKKSWFQKCQTVRLGTWAGWGRALTWLCWCVCVCVCVCVCGFSDYYAFRLHVFIVLFDSSKIRFYHQPMYVYIWYRHNPYIIHSHTYIIIWTLQDKRKVRNDFAARRVRFNVDKVREGPKTSKQLEIEKSIAASRARQAAAKLAGGTDKKKKKRWETPRCSTTLQWNATFPLVCTYILNQICVWSYEKKTTPTQKK